MYDEELDNSRPWDLLDKNKYTDEETRNRHYDICLSCERLFKPTRTCRECGCFMNVKTWLKDAHCPIGKW